MPARYVRVPVLLILLALAGLTGLLGAGHVSALGDDQGAALGAGPVSAQAGDPDERPDIVVVMVDDLGYIDDDRILKRLPNIRRVWRDGGMRLRQMYDETPLCCPARATFLTGRHTLHHGVTRNDGDLLDPATTVAVALHDAGYHTIQAGKYLNGYDGDRQPIGWDHTSIVRSLGSATYWRDGELVTYRPEYVDAATGRQAVDWVRAAPRDRPLFSWTSTSAPHVCAGTDAGLCYEPIVMPEDRDAAACAGIAKFKPPSYRVWDTPQDFPREMPAWPAGWKLRTVCESLLVVDRMVGQLVQAQAARGRPAWFVFLSDNGMSWGQKGFPQKHVPTATRLPVYVAGPGVGTGGSDVMLSNIDIAPTLAEIGGTALPGADGTSFLPLLRGQPFAGRSSILELQTTAHPVARVYWAAIRTRSWHFIRWSTGRRELYRRNADPWELDDRIKSDRAKAKELEAKLDALLEASY